MTSTLPAHDTPRERNWADILAIVVGLALLAVSIWPGDITGSADAQVEVGQPTFVHLLRILAGVGAITAVFLAQRWRRRGTARVVLVASAACLIIGLAAFDAFAERALVTMLIPALLLLVAATKVGPIPLR